jgi:hypothetical protein
MSRKYSLASCSVLRTRWILPAAVAVLAGVSILVGVTLAAPSGAGVSRGTQKEITAAVRSAMLAYYAKYDIPYWAGPRWVANSSDFREGIARTLVPRQREDVSRYWSGWKRSDLLSNVDIADLVQSDVPTCCSKVSDVRVTSISFEGRTLHVHADERSSFLTASASGAGKAARFRWQRFRQNESVDITFERIHSHYLATGFTPSWAQGLQG